MNLQLQPSENKLEGAVIVKDGKPVFDSVVERINWLIEHHLKYIASDDSGWFSLYEDPVDGRLWEKSFNQSDVHGGGAPCLLLIEYCLAEKKYNL